MQYFDVTIVYGTKKKLRTWETSIKAKNVTDGLRKALNDLFIEKGCNTDHIKQTLITEV